MSFSVTILGSSGALPAYGRHPSSQFVEIQNKCFLIDCGEAAQMQLMRFDMNYHRINHIFISHLHGDHFLGLMGLLFTLHLQRRANDLHLYAHRGLDEIITAQLRYSQSVSSFKIIFHVIEPDARYIIFEDDTLTIETIPLIHKLPCSGFLFREKPKPRRIDKTAIPEGLKLQHMAALKRGEDIMDDSGNILHSNSALTFPPRKSRSYAYCSDTCYNPGMAAQLQEVDLLYHEATFTQDELSKAIETRHSTAAQAATIAKEAAVQQLLIGHFSARYRDLAPLLEEAKNIFPNTQLAIEGQQYTIQE